MFSSGVAEGCSTEVQREEDHFLCDDAGRAWSAGCIFNTFVRTVLCPVPSLACRFPALTEGAGK